MRPETIRCLLKFAVEIRLKEAVRPDLDAWGFNPKRLETESGRLELRALATRYYRITHEAIRRYDPHHLIIGDRYEAGQPIADEVIATAASVRCATRPSSLMPRHCKSSPKRTATRQLGCGALTRNNCRSTDNDQERTMNCG